MSRFEIKSGSLISVKSGGSFSDKDFETTVFLGDCHIPFHDPDTLANVYEFIKDFQPDHIFILGDWVDFKDLSKFEKEPDDRFRLQKDLDLSSNYLADLRSITPKSHIVFMAGNHEDRLRKWIWRNPDVAGLRSLSIPELLDLDNLRIEYCGYGELYDHHGFIVKHGDIVRKYSGMTARAEMEKVGKSGISGHTHRLSSYFRRTMDGTMVWYECGCLCELNPEWVHYPDWQQGFAVAWFEKAGNRFFVNLIPIIKSRFIFNGTYYKK